MKNKKIKLITTFLCLMAVSVMLASCGTKNTESNESEPTKKETVQVKEISNFDNDGEKVESTLPRTLYETKDKLVFYTTQGVFTYDITKKKISEGFAIMDSEYAKEGESAGKIPLNFQGDVTFTADTGKDNKEIYIFPQDRKFYYIYNVADKKVTKVNEMYKKTISDEKGLDKLINKQESGWTSGNGEANIKDYKYKSPTTGKVYRPFAK
ncbi:hypothetical protein HMPREF0378_0798 [Eubacterium nodatum ATCC 33099]|nr:hypothetical protein HMPREF0378_0798 [Eubacterium nodatum ATCC 33099]